ncbi:MAG: hypothetical protein HY743_01830, partial [Deltaproteobacteria bacterium]|nr:hypothetical protein [Deltaproteobacteria bacterium]
MPPVEYSWEIRERAKELYVVDGLTFEEVAAALPDYFPAPTPSVTQLKRWSDEEKEWAESRGEDGKTWKDARKEFRLALSSIRRDSVLLRAKLIGQALDTPEFKEVLSAAMWEKTQAHKDIFVGRPSRPPMSDGPQAGIPEPLAGETPALQIKTPQDAVAGLEEALARHLAAMLGGLKPIDLKALKNFKDCLGLIEDLKAKYRPDEKTGQAPGLTAETA